MSRIRNKYNFFKNRFKLNFFGLLFMLAVFGAFLMIFFLAQEKQFVPEQKKIVIPIVQQ